MDLDCDITYFEVGVVLLINQTCKHSLQEIKPTIKKKEEMIKI